MTLLTEENKRLRVSSVNYFETVTWYIKDMMFCSILGLIKQAIQLDDSMDLYHRPIVSEELLKMSRQVNFLEIYLPVNLCLCVLQNGWCVD